MENKAVVFCVVTGVLGIISAIVGFIGEGTRVKDDEISSNTIGDIIYCTYPVRPTLSLAILGIVFAIITQVYISIPFGACKYFRYAPNSTTKSKCFLIFSWIATVVAVVQFSRAINGSKHGGYVDAYGVVYCYILKPGIFAVAAVFALLSAIFGIAAYLTGIGAQQTTTNPPIVGVPMGATFDLERNAVPKPTPQYPPPQNPPPQYSPQQYPPPQYAPPQNPPPQYPTPQYPPPQ